jgi:transcriptional regulator with XRE-family HTH domain
MNIESAYKLGFTGHMSNPLESLRRKAGLTMQQLADLAGTTAPQINKLEKGQRDLDKKWAMRLAPYLDVSAEDILFPGQSKFMQGDALYESLYEAPVYGLSASRESGYAINKAHIISKKPANIATMGKNGFYVTVVGDAMEPLFEEGQVLSVNPEYPLVKGKPCLIETINNESLIRKFVSRNEKTLQCQQLNPAETQTLKMAEIVRVSRIVGQEF